MVAVPIIYFAIATGLVWLIFLIMAAIRACTGDYNSEPVGHLRPPPPPRSEDEKSAMRAAVERNLPEIRLDHEVTCPVCLDVISLDEDARRLDCQHCFHSTCISSWLVHGASKHWDEKAIQCPVCRHTQALHAHPHTCPDVIGS